MILLQLSDMKKDISTINGKAPPKAFNTYSNGRVMNALGLKTIIPRNQDVSFKIAKSLLDRNRAQKAIILFEKILQAEPDLIEIDFVIFIFFFI